MAQYQVEIPDDEADDLTTSQSFAEMWEDLTSDARVLLVLAALLGLFLFAFGIFSIVVGALQPTLSSAAYTIAYALVLIISTVFLVYFAFDGVVNENKYEVAAFLFVTYMLFTRIAFMWVTGRFFDETRNLPLYIALNYAALAMLVLSALFVVPNTMYTYRAWKSFGWKMYRSVGTDKQLKDMFRIYQIFLSLLKIDLQFACMLVVLGGFFIFSSVTDSALWINVVLVIVTIFWTFVAVQAMKRENKLLLLLVCLFALVEPGYIIFKVVTLFSTVARSASDPRTLFAVTGVLAVANRVILFVFIVRCYRNWGPGGLKEKVFFRRDF